MAAPIIDEITVTPSTVQPGGSADIRILAHDPDSALVELIGTVTDQAGATSEISGTVTISDALTYALIASVGTVVQDADDPALFHWTDG